jgi:hypothetical protein
MQAAPFKNNIFPAWGLCLVSFRSSVNFLSKFDLSFETVNMVKLWAVVLLRLKHGSVAGIIPFWLIWCCLALKSMYRFMTHFAAPKHLWYGPSSQLLHGYMSRNSNADWNPHTMVGCKYLVYGEQKSISDDPHTMSLITLDKIWQLNGLLDCRINQSGMRNKHLVMAFALSRLLRCRLEGAELHYDTITKDLICSMLEPALQSETVPSLQPVTEQVTESATIRVRIPDDEEEEDNADKATELLGILQMEINFLNEHLNNGYPVIFGLGLPSCLFHVGLSALRLGSLIWFLFQLFWEFATAYHPSPLLLFGTPDKTVTALAIVILMVIDLIELNKYVTSRWTRLLALCKYVSCSSRCLRFLLGFMISDGNGIFPVVERLKFSTNYDLLQSSTYKSGKLKPFTPKMIVGERLLTSNKKSYEIVMAALCQALARHLKEHQPRVCVPVNKELQIQFVTDSDGCMRLPPVLIPELVRHMVTDCLPGVGLTLTPPPPSSDRTASYWSAFLQLQSCSHVILVWHIATSLCAMDLATVTAANPVPENRNLGKAQKVATYLSCYSLYLLIWRPTLLPGNVVASKTVLLDTIESAREMLEDCVSWEDKYAKLLPEEAARARQHRQADISLVGNMSEQGTSNIRLDGNILEQGTILAKELITKETDEVRWEILAEVWTDLFLHIAPSSNGEAHMQKLSYGAEFVTVLWALLSHCGIEKSKLWPEIAHAGGTIQEHLKTNAAHARVEAAHNSAPPA